MTSISITDYNVANEIAPKNFIELGHPAALTMCATLLVRQASFDVYDFRN